MNYCAYFRVWKLFRAEATLRFSQKGPVNSRLVISCVNLVREKDYINKSVQKVCKIEFSPNNILHLSYKYQGLHVMLVSKIGQNLFIASII
jgi:hypothetical protein